MRRYATVSVSRPHPGALVRLGNDGMRAALKADLNAEARAKGFEIIFPEWFEIGSDGYGDRIYARATAVHDG